ncbi:MULTISPECIES: restriction endonuclease [unclassified Luteococcus]|uniref:restriction endonuclease n=1 Tax=unclassified Luteococcus TaxID=2639923 RepID=UPI00313D0CF2
MITVPIWPEFVLPILEVLADGNTRTTREMRTAAFDRMALDEAARAEVLASGDSRAHNRAGWAITHVHKAGWIERVARGSYRLTDAGREAMNAHAGGFHDYAHASKVLDPFWETPEPAVQVSASDELPVSPVDPVEQIEGAVAELNAAVAAESLDRLRAADPTFFEEAVVKVLLAMGYGGAEQRGHRIGGTGDGGVDGVIDQDALGLEQIYVQAKRYAEGNNVGRETIQAFIGALAGVGASRGVFITSSDFTVNAVNYAQGIPTRVILINGQRLASLMIKYRVGVQTKQTYEVVELDEDFFE